MNIACLEDEVVESHALLATQQNMIKMYTDRPENIPPLHVTTFKDIIEKYQVKKKIC